MKISLNLVVDRKSGKQHTIIPAPSQSAEELSSVLMLCDPK
jgi:hypothetical protein